MSIGSAGPFGTSCKPWFKKSKANVILSMSSYTSYCNYIHNNIIIKNTSLLGMSTICCNLNEKIKINSDKMMNNIN